MALILFYFFLSFVFVLFLYSYVYLYFWCFFIWNATLAAGWLTFTKLEAIQRVYQQKQQQA